MGNVAEIAETGRDAEISENNEAARGSGCELICLPSFVEVRSGFTGLVANPDSQLLVCPFQDTDFFLRSLIGRVEQGGSQRFNHGRAALDQSVEADRLLQPIGQPSHQRVHDRTEGVHLEDAADDACDLGYELIGLIKMVDALHDQVAELLRHRGRPEIGRMDEAFSVRAPINPSWSESTSCSM